MACMRMYIYIYTLYVCFNGRFRAFCVHMYIDIYIYRDYTSLPGTGKRGCFNWMIPDLYHGKMAGNHQTSIR